MNDGWPLDTGDGSPFGARDASPGGEDEDGSAAASTADFNAGEVDRPPSAGGEWEESSLFEQLSMLSPELRAEVMAQVEQQRAATVAEAGEVLSAEEEGAAVVPAEATNIAVLRWVVLQ